MVHTYVYRELQRNTKMFCIYAAMTPAEETDVNSGS